MNDISIQILPSYISSDGQLQEFQREMMEFATNSDKKVALLSAPTGSGKTYGFKKMVLNEGFILILLPNNLLSTEVFNDFADTEDNVVLLNSNSVKNKLEEYKKKGFENITKDEVIECIITSKKIVISNPELFYYIILNKYKYGNRSDSLTSFIKDGLKLIIIDEVHVYSRDQINIILAILKVINPNIKIMFSSATIPNFFENLISLLFMETNILKINAIRESVKNKNNKILQGPLNISIPPFNDITTFIHNNGNLMEKGNWFIIADSIRNMQSIYNELKKIYNKDEIGMISAYHDPEYFIYKELLNSNRYRIIIGSNIIEQGINPPKYFNNYIIEPGIDIKNFIQRVGRIGRNTPDTSNVYIIFKSSIANTEEIEKIHNINELFNFAEKKLPEKAIVTYAPKYIGIYSAIISQTFSYHLQKTIDDNFNKDRDGVGFFNGYYSALNAINFLSKIKCDKKYYYTVKREISDIKSIMDWWDIYYESIFRFIPQSDKTIGYDLEERMKFSYDFIWIKRNKKIVSENEGFIKVQGFNDKPDNNFNTYVEGIPFDRIEVDYKVISPYSARSFIIRKMKENLDNICTSDVDIKKFIGSLQDFIYATADYDRLKIEVID